MKNKKAFYLSMLNGTVFAAIPIFAYLALLFIPLFILPIHAATILSWFVYLGFWGYYAVPPVINFAAFQFMVGFAEAMRALSPSPEKQDSSAQDLEDRDRNEAADEKFFKDLEGIKVNNDATEPPGHNNGIDNNKFFDEVEKVKIKAQVTRDSDKEVQ